MKDLPTAHVFALIIALVCASAVLFPFTSGGWVFIAVAAMSTLAHAAALFGMVAVWFIVRTRPTVRVPLLLVLAVGILYTTTVLLAPGDCGDNDGAYVFYQLLHGTGRLARCSASISAPPIGALEPLLANILLLVFAALLLTLTRSRRQEDAA